MAEELKDLIHQRGTIKARLTVFSKYLDIMKQVNPDQVEPVQVGELQFKLNRLQEMLPLFDDVQSKIEKLSIDNIDFQITERDNIESSFCRYVALAQNLLESFSAKRDGKHPESLNTVRSGSCGSCSNSTVEPDLHIKLPIMKLPSFDGNHLMWLEFRETFESLIHNNNSLPQISKFLYLRNSLIGSAAVVIKSIDCTASNYEMAWNLVCERFNNKRILINNHTKSLFTFESISRESHKSICYMVDHYSKNLRSLEKLGEPVQFWDTLIIYIMTSRLDSATSRRWEEHRNTLQLSPSLADFFEFLRNRANVLQTIENGKVDTNRSDKNLNKDQRSTKSFIVSNSASSSINCVYCLESHLLHSCDKFKDLTLSARWEVVKKNKLCQNCLRPNHSVPQCRLGPCRICKKRHNSLLHKQTNSAQVNNTYSSSTNSDVTNTQADESSLVPSVALSAIVTQQVLLCTAEIEIVDPVTKRSYPAKALLDSGSQSSFLSEKMKQIMNISCVETKPVSICGVNDIVVSSVVKSCNLKVKSRLSNFDIEVSFLVIPKITGRLPSVPVDVTKLNLPSHVQLADTTFSSPSEIHALLGADVFWEIVASNQIKLGPHKPILQESKFGWLVTGPIHMALSSSKISCNFSSEIRESLAKFWEIEEIPSSTHKLFTKDEEYCETHFVNHTQRLPDGRFSVKLPFRESPEEALTNSFNTAQRLLFGLEKRITKSGLINKYREFLKEYENLGHSTEVSRPPFGYYIPHHAVVREQSETTKLRVVFNASQKTSSGKSLNDIMLVGPVIQDDLLSILLRFRLNNFVVTADIANFYRQIMVDDSQRHLQLILWRPDFSLPIKVYQLNTVTYGTAAAPFLSTRCLVQLANECTDEEVARVIKHDFYVDDLNTGCSNKDDLKRVINNVVKKLEEGCFPLRKFRTNVPDIFNNMSVVDQCQDFSKDSNVLGLKWSPTSDTLQFSTALQVSPDVTKRSILSTSCKVFDPLGLLSACTIIPKVILQSLWRLNSGWDDPVPNEIKCKWELFVNNIACLVAFKIPRCVLSQNAIEIELHCFTDASEIAYGACIYVKSVDSTTKTVQVNLLTAKARVAPIKPELTIPRLELMGALLGARVIDKIKNSLRIPILKLTYWCDSTIVLGWLKSEPKTLKTYVCNRVEEIRKLTDESAWRHIPTHLNPADLASRGVPPHQLIDNSMWWHGPTFLLQSEAEWPASSPGCRELPETKRCMSLQCVDNIVPFEKYSKLSKLQRVFAYVLRFISNCKRNNFKISGQLKAKELQASLIFLAKQSQKESFHKDIHSLSTYKCLHSKSSILPLSPFIDKDHILRVGGRIQNASHCQYDKIHPILIDSKHVFTKLLFEAEHLRLLHCGPQQLLSSIRDRFWAIGGRSLSTRTVNKCVTCRRFKAQTLQPIMGNLPRPRVTPAPPFENCGTDFAGPFLISNRKGRGARTTKCYLCIFVCLCTKAVHLEVVSELSTNAFMLCLRRFIARRGKPQTIYCDNGRNFVGASNEIGRLLKSCEAAVDDFAASEGIIFKFSPAYSPNFGGIWEAGVKSAKHHLKRIVGNSSLTFEELSTLFSQIEAILNSRPLTALSADPADLRPLTPGHFLIGRPLTALPSPTSECIQVNRYQLIERLRSHFWRRWNNEFLSDLQQRVKWRSQGAKVKLGDLVIIKDESLPPMKWLMGRIHELYPGNDGVSRVVDIKTTKGIIRRALTKVCALEPVDSHELLETCPFKGGEDVHNTTN